MAARATFPGPAPHVGRAPKVKAGLPWRGMLLLPFKTWCDLRVNRLESPPFTRPPRLLTPRCCTAKLPRSRPAAAFAPGRPSRRRASRAAASCAARKDSKEVASNNGPTSACSTNNNSNSNSPPPCSTRGSGARRPPRGRRCRARRLSDESPLASRERRAGAARDGDGGRALLPAAGVGVGRAHGASRRAGSLVERGALACPRACSQRPRSARTAWRGCA